MTTTLATQATPEEVSPYNVVKTEGVQLVNTNNGEIVFINTNFVSQKLINLLSHILNGEDYTLSTGENYGTGMYSVVFRIDGGPWYPNEKGEMEEVPWLFVESSKTAVCNIKQCITLAFEQGLSDDERWKNNYHLDMKHLVWQHIIGGFLHECHHAETFMDDYLKIITDNAANKKEEESANAYSEIALMELAKQVNIEMDLGPVIEAMYAEAWSLLWEELTTTPDDELTEKEKLFIDCQKEMMDSDIVWFTRSNDPEYDNQELRTYKETLHFFSGDAKDDPEWALDTTPKNVETVTYNNSASQKDANGIDQGTPAEGQFNPNDPGQGTDCMYQETVNPAQGFQGATPQPPVNQNMGYAPNPANGFQGQAPVNQPVNQPVAPNVQNMPVPPQTEAQPNHGGQNPSAQVGAVEFAPSGLDLDQFQQLVNNLYYKIFDNIFDSCGFNPMNGPGQQFFHQKAKIVEPVMLTPEEQAIVHGMACYDQNGVVMENAQVNDWISGIYVDNNKDLPGYILTLSNMQGQRIQRRFIPQNPWKTNASGAYSQTALLAQQGTKVMWIIDPAEQDKQFATRIIGRQLQSNRGGKWVNI